MLLRALPLVAGIVPIVAIFLSYGIGVRSGVLAECNPFLDGCVSISATGRYLPASLLFHAVMLPQSALLLFIWYFASLWLRSVAPDSRAPLIVNSAGLVGALALILYVTFLGTTGSVYEFMRRFGIYLYFLGTAIAQLALALALLSRIRRGHLAHLKRATVAMLWLCILPFALGILNVVLKAVLADADAWENRIEWLAALSMQGYFVALYIAWRESDFAIEARAR